MSFSALDNEVKKVISLYRKKYYEDVLLLSHKLLKTYGLDPRLLSLIRKSRFFSFVRSVHAGFILCGIGFIFLTWSFVSAYGNLKEQLVQKDEQIDTLVDEVGGLKVSQLRLLREYILSRKDVNFLSSQVDSLEKNISSAEDDTLENAESIVRVDPDVMVNNQPSQENSSADSTSLLVSSLSTSVPPAGTTAVLVIGSHAGLTDTLLLGLINSETDMVTLISIPRDLYVNGRKINEYFVHFGVDKLADIVFDVTGIKPNYYAQIDLSRFENVIDLLGGLDVEVKRDLYDKSFPGPGGTYTTFSVKAGLQHFDGATALKYVRSRKSTSDFDRADRQHQVLVAIKKRIFDLELAQNPVELTNLYTSIYGAITTDIDLLQALVFLRAYKDFEINSGNVLSTANFLYSTYNERGQYILLPRDGNFSAIKGWVKELIGI